MIDMTGKRFGRLTVIEVDGKMHGALSWKCLCDCGNEITVYGPSLRKGLTKSCGCWHKEIASQTNKRYNKIEIVGNTGICYTSSGKMFFVDAEDVNKISNYSWWSSGKGYIKTSAKGKRGSVSLHRFLLGLGEYNGIQVDHIDRNPANNRKCNLRLCLSKENQRNIGVRKNNSSGCTGVMFDKDRNKWRARIVVDGKEKHLGRFDTIEEAINARLDAEKKYFGEFAPMRNDGVFFSVEK